MTENNAAQPGLNDTIRAVFLEHGFTIKHGQTDLKPYVYEAVHALLSKLRAEGVQAGEPAFYINAAIINPETGRIKKNIQGALTWSETRVGGWQMPVYTSTALESATVTDESPMAKMAEALREKARQEQQAYQDRRNQATEWGPIPEGTEADSAPVAGEAQSYPGDDVAARLDNMADDQPPGSQAQSDLYAAATLWRKHIAHRTAPQASEAVRLDEDAERWRWATAVDDNAETLHSIVMCHGGDQQKINERADFYRAGQADKDVGDCAKGES